MRIYPLFCLSLCCCTCYFLLSDLIRLRIEVPRAERWDPLHHQVSAVNSLLKYSFIIIFNSYIYSCLKKAWPAILLKQNVPKACWEAQQLYFSFCYLILLRFIIIVLPVAFTKILFACWQAHKRDAQAWGSWDLSKPWLTGRASGFPQALSPDLRVLRRIWVLLLQCKWLCCVEKRWLLCPHVQGNCKSGELDMFVIFESAKQDRIMLTWVSLFPSLLVACVLVFGCLDMSESLCWWGYA